MKAKSKKIADLPPPNEAEKVAASQAQSVKIEQPIMVPIDQIEPDPMNANEQTPETFNSLVEDIRTDGFDEALQVCLLEGDAGTPSARYIISGGEHRWKAAKVIGMTELPVVVKPWDEHTRRLKMVRRNLLRGDLNDAKFTALVKSLKERDSQLTDDRLSKVLGFDSQDEYMKHLIAAKAADDEETRTWLKDMMKGTGNEIEAVNGLSDILNNIFSQYGDTVPQSFLFFAYKGKTHLCVFMNGDLKDLIEKAVEEVKASGTNMNAWLTSKLGASNGQGS